MTVHPTLRMKLRHPERLIYTVARFTKRDVVDYYRRIAPVLLPHLHDRPVTLKRYPDHIYSDYFYEKDAPAFTPKWVQTFAVWRRSGQAQIHYILINDARTLEWAASVGTVEIHPFLARTDEFASPTYIVFDLDPGEGADLLRCAPVALRLRDLLTKLGLKSLAKVSGSKGLQVYVPLNTPTTYSVTEAFARATAELLATEHPREVIAEMQKSRRKNKVFIDWSQNTDYKTTIAVYSLRSNRHHPYVSAPVTWDELERAIDHADKKSLDFAPDAVFARVRQHGDLFAAVERLKQTLPETFLRSLPHGTVKAPTTAARTERNERPRASEQGGRRSFRVIKDGVFTLLLQVHDTQLAFSVSKLPTRAGEAHTATPATLRSPRGEAWDSGTVELIEGNAARGYLDLYFDGDKLRGEYILMFDGEWRLIRPAPDKEYVSATFLDVSRKKSGVSTVQRIA